MGLIFGILVVFASVIGGFLIAEGKILTIWQPNELLIIGGAALGSFIIAQPFEVMKKTTIYFFRLLINPNLGKHHYMDVIAVLVRIGSKIRKSGLMSLEDDLDRPTQSLIFSRFPRVLEDKKLLNFIVDNFRVIISTNLSQMQLEALLDSEIEAMEEELYEPVQAINNLAESLPGFGIVAAVLGIVITMQFLDGSPGDLGIRIAAALVGTFLGVFLAYGFVGPIGKAIEHITKQELQQFYSIKSFVMAFMSGCAPSLSAEFARRNLSSNVRPGFLELEELSKRERSVKG